LDVSDFANLEKFSCSENQLTQLILPNNNKLEVIYADNNFLTSFDYTQLNPQTCTELRLFNNNLEKTNISVFSQLVNLTDLDIGNENKAITVGGKVNQFYGSLESLQNLTELKKLDISNTDVNSGLEYLSLESLPQFNSNCVGFRATPIKKFLNSYQGGFDK
jgi:hypothetical protein